MEKTKTELEKRVFGLQTLEVRAGDDLEGKPMIAGHAAVFNELSEELWGFREMIAPGAFDDVLDDDVRATYNHDSNFILGRSSADTLQIEQDEKGLRVTIEPPETTWARDLLVSIKRGDVKEMSFAFRIAEDGDKWAVNEAGEVIRTITRFKELNDVSVVAFPAYPQTTAEVRSKLDRVKAEVDPPAEENELREKRFQDLNKNLRLKRMSIEMGGSA